MSTSNEASARSEINEAPEATSLADGAQRNNNKNVAIESFWDDGSTNMDALEPAKKKRAVATNTKLGFSFPFVVSGAVDVQPSVVARTVIQGLAPTDDDLDKWMQRLQVTPEQVDLIS